jgi:hypothetical protein
MGLTGGGGPSHIAVLSPQPASPGPAAAAAAVGAVGSAVGVSAADAGASATAVGGVATLSLIRASGDEEARPAAHEEADHVTMLRG